jgi:hypothetical protein
MRVSFRICEAPGPEFGDEMADYPLRNQEKTLREKKELHEVKSGF